MQFWMYDVFANDNGNILKDNSNKCVVYVAIYNHVFVFVL